MRVLVDPINEQCNFNENASLLNSYYARAVPSGRKLKTIDFSISELIKTPQNTCSKPNCKTQYNRPKRIRVIGVFAL